MAFKRDEVSELLVQCRRSCCVCHRFCGVKIETDHMVPSEEGKDDSIDNAIPVCFDCHAEIHAYNDKHPRGRKFTPEELRRHKNQWLSMCSKETQKVLGPSARSSANPLQALIDELIFNRHVAAKFQIKELGGRYHTQQLPRAINDGVITFLESELRDTIINAYREMDATNQLLSALWQNDRRSNNWAELANDIQSRHRALLPVLDKTIRSMHDFIGANNEIT